MKKMKKPILYSKIIKNILLVLLIIPFVTIAQDNQKETVEKYTIDSNDANNPCISVEEYTILEKTCNDNSKLFKLKALNNRNVLTPALNWPLRQGNGLNDCNYYIITNNVDNNNTSGIQDYNCGTRTYNGHRGTDIVPEPYPFYKMDNNQLEVIAAADGTIVAKADGNFDKNCTTGASAYQGNYIALQHSDGSRTLYYHMKTNSLTSKIIGQTVVSGEFLGTVGSSGSSNIPHLHFEVWSGSTSTTIVDPFYGTCNTLIPSTLWANQNSYKETGILKIQLNSVAPVLTTCPTTETPNELNCFAPGATARFYRWIRDDEMGMVTNMRIINPDGTTFDSWTGTGNTTFNLALYNSTRTLPSIPGIYTYEAVYNSVTCTKPFLIDCSLSVNENELNPIASIYPNPFSTETTLEFNSNLENATLNIFNSLGQQVKELKGISDKKIIINRDDLSNGVYFISISQKNKVIYTNKIIIR